ncbi:hypothetical protein NEOLEDRAFT_1159406 [Neolentinus lepideus HHB14362 ss-1]|uniref:DNA mismatch repair proteins mutS family domain-containing protein n=1 Tax=Neolentinus lepideus HHB14362 ss-1 TaxID=1314782 RepID=A0A165MQ17_9AGAM|nr:hypothetical protein NEOLEDRAFT_1159406 [Neolentinus lepideus HHB14362 ss-1]
MPHPAASNASRQKWSTRGRKRRAVTVESPEDIVECAETENEEKKRVRWDSEVDERPAEDGESTDEEDASKSKSDKICLTTCCQFGRMACAYYDPLKCMIYVLEDTPENGYFDLIQTLLDQINPSIILTSSKTDDNFMDVLRSAMDVSGGVFQIRPHKDFIAGKGRDRLLSLGFLSELPLNEDHRSMRDSESSSSEVRNAYDFMKRRKDITGDPLMKKWSASIRVCNFASLDTAPLCLACIGALLDYLARERAIGELEDGGLDGLDIRGIEPLALEQFMQINSDALFSLQVFENENHASIHSDKTKEGLSLYGVLNHTKTTLGRLLLRTWCLRPSLSIEVINARHDAVACFLRPENLVTADSMHNMLKGIKNVPKILATMKAGKGGISEWQGLVKFTFYSALLRDALSELYQGSTVQIISKLIASLDIPSFREVGTLVNETIDWEESSAAGRVCVRPHIDGELDNRKRIYHGIDDVLSRVAQQICHTVPPDYATSLNVVYFPQLGFLICIPMLEQWKNNEEITEIEGWSFQVYMDTHIGDLHPAIVDREIEIVQSLLERVLTHYDVMAQACDTCAELDCLLSFAQASRAFDYRRPRMTEDNIIDIKQGRHPLQEQVVDTFVPNNTFLVGGCGSGGPSYRYTGSDDATTMDEDTEANSVLVCTGANACGKTALIVYMAQSLFVPAASATLGITDKIFTRIQTRESVSRVQSAFMIDLNQVSLALRNSTKRSLILLDEFGKGTHFANRESDCPKIMATTHFHELFADDLLDPRSLSITFIHMQVMITSSNGEILDVADPDGTMDDDEETRRVGPGERITYLYRVAKGLALDSHAAKCAEIFGIPRRIVRRAQYVTHLLSTHSLGKLLDEEMSEQERNDLEDAEAVCRRFLAWDFGEQDGVRKGNVKERLAGVLGRISDPIADGD